MLKRTVSIFMYTLLNLSLLCYGVSLKSNLVTVNKWPFKQHELKQFKGWFGLKINAGPIQYLSSVDVLSKQVSYSCMKPFAEGDLLHIIITPSSCNFYRQRLKSKTRLALGLKLHLNLVNEKDLLPVPRVGSSLAHRIVQGQPWSNFDQLLELKGIGLRTLNKFKNYLSLESPKLIWPY